MNDRNRIQLAYYQGVLGMARRVLDAVDNGCSDAAIVDLASTMVKVANELIDELDDDDE